MRIHKVIVFFCAFIQYSVSAAQKIDLANLSSPLLFKGDSTTAYRDPAIYYHQDTFYLYFTLVETESDGKIFSYTAQSRSKDLINWSSPEKITARDQNLNFCSPGNIIKYRGDWILCLQTYPRNDYKAEQAPRYGDQSARVYLMKSKDLRTWGSPKIMMVKGKDTRVEDMGRMIDPYIIEDKDVNGKYWCFYKQNGVSLSYSYDLENWTFFGSANSGENVCVIIKQDEYVLFHSPANGIGIKRSKNLLDWTDDETTIYLGQNQWDWAKGRISAGTILELEGLSEYRYVMFFHGSGPLTEREGDFDKNASIGIAWSNDMKDWDWPVTRLLH